MPLKGALNRVPAYSPFTGASTTNSHSEKIRRINMIAKYFVMAGVNI